MRQIIFSYLLFTGFFLLCCLGLNAQVVVSGVIADKETGDPLPYAHIIKKRTNLGTITNEDGFFKINCRPDTDTLVITYIGYNQQEVPCSYFTGKQKLLIPAAANELGTALIFSDYDFLYDMIIAAKKNLAKSTGCKSKVYFTLETASHGIPVELIECYYNVDPNSQGMQSLGLKNGRIGMSGKDGYFVSLNTTKVISDYLLLERWGNEFPANPLQFPGKKLRKTYALRLTWIQNDIYEIEFEPLTKDEELFSGTIWIRNNDKRILKLNLYENNLQKHPLVATEATHKVDSLNFNITYTFYEKDEECLQKIEFQYDLKYNNTLNIRDMYSKGVFIFYDKNKLFNLPYFDTQANFISDYDKIVSQPYNEKFWEQNIVLSPSKKVLAYQDFINKNGVLLNFDELSKRSKIFHNKFIPWSEKRILMNQLNKVAPPHVRYLKDNIQAARTRSELYKFSYNIYLDMNTFNDSTFYTVKTLINLDESFYYLTQDEFTESFVNLYFDLVEIAKRELQEELEGGQWNDTSLQALYTSTINKLNEKLERYLNSVDHGNDKEQLLNYIEKIKNELKVDNSELIHEVK